MRRELPPPRRASDVAARSCASRRSAATSPTAHRVRHRRRRGELADSRARRSFFRPRIRRSSPTPCRHHGRAPALPERLACLLSAKERFTTIDNASARRAHVESLTRAVLRAWMTVELTTLNNGRGSSPTTCATSRPCPSGCGSAPVRARDGPRTRHLTLPRHMAFKVRAAQRPADRRGD